MDLSVRKRQWHTSALLLFFIFALVLDYFMTSHGILRNDFPFHYERLMELHRDLATGQFPLVRETYGTVQGNAVMMFYPWLTILPLALLTFVFHSYVMIERVAVLIVLAGWLLSSYFSSKSFFHSKGRAKYFAIVYSASMEAVLFEQGDLGTSLALVFAPLVFFGFLHLKEDGHWRMLTVGMTFMMYSHVITSFLFVILLVALFLLNIKQFFDKWRTCCLAGLVTTLATAPFWAVLLWFSLNNKVATPVTTLGFNHYGIDLFVLLIIFVVPVILIARALYRYSYFDNQILILSVLCGALMISPIGRLAVKVIPCLSRLQFGDRFMPILSVLGAYLVTKYVYSNSDKVMRKLSKIILWTGIIMTPLVLAGRSGLAVASHNTSKLYMSSKVFRSQYLYGTSISWLYDYSSSHAMQELHGLKHEAVRISPKGTDMDIKQTHGYTVVPMSVYQGLHYQFEIDGHRMKPKQLDKGMTRQFGLLTVKGLSSGHHLVQMKSVRV